MSEFDIVYKNIKLRVLCDKFMVEPIKNHFNNHAYFFEVAGVPTYTVVIGENIRNYTGSYYRMIDKWFDNSSLDCYIDNKNKICYATNFCIKKAKHKNLLVQYFVANFFNRLLELNGYLGIHSSCVERDNYGILFVAERYNGKTICMLNLMNNGYNSVTNDIIALKQFKDEVIGYGIAQSISIRLGPAFCSQQENQKYVELAKKKGIEIKDKEMIEGNSIHISDSELAALNKVKQSIDTRIGCIIRPCYDPYITYPTFERLSEEYVRELIYSQYRSLVHETTDFLINVKLDNVDEKARYAYLDYLVKIPAYYCRQNEKTTNEFVKGIEKIRKK